MPWRAVAPGGHYGGREELVPRLIGQLVSYLLPDYRYVTQRTSPWGYWPPVAERMLTACEHSTSGDIATWTWGHSTITIPCSRLRR